MSANPPALDLGAQPHHDGSALYVQPQRFDLGAVVQVRIRVPSSWDVDTVHVRTAPDGEQRFDAAWIAHRTANETWWQAEVECHNPVTNYRFLLDGPAGYRWLNGAGLHHRDVPDAADFRLVSHPAPPGWAADAVVYQVFPDRFARDASVEPATGVSDARTDLPSWATPARWDEEVDSAGSSGPQQVFGGTLAGIVDHLDHLEYLGVDVLYLTPFFPARSNHRYDAATFDEVDPILGGTRALVRLQAEAHARGIRVMGDITTNHTGNEHAWFRAAEAGDARYAEWYVRDGDHWITWLGVPSLPKLDHRSAGLREAMISAPGSSLRRWLGPGRGLDSWRVDVANMTGRYRDVDLAHEVARACRAAVDKETGGEALLVAEHVHDHSGDVDGDGWHGVMNYSAFTKPAWTWLRHEDYAPKFLGSPARMPRLPAEDMVATIREFAALVPWGSLTHSMTLLGSHDTSRVRTLVGDDSGLVEVGAALLLTMPGIPMITYGDEIGMRGDFGEDGRRPMPWAAQGRDANLWDQRLLETYRSLIGLRKDVPALRRGGLRWLAAQGDGVVFLRETDREVVLVHLARAAHPTITLDLTRLPDGCVGGRAVYGDAPRIDRTLLRLAAAGPTVRVYTWASQAPPYEPRPEQPAMQKETSE